MKLKKLLAPIAFSAFATGAFADDKDSVTAFYELLSNPGSAEHVAAFEAVTTEDWKSFGDYSDHFKTRDEFLKQMGGFAKLIPDMNWKIEQIVEDGNTVAVRSRATGTPAGPFFGVNGEGRGFDIMTIDIHELKDGKIARSYHVEDWAGALRQLKGK